MNIARERRSRYPDGTIVHGPLSGKERYYRDALFSTLVHLKPKVCLEIGTHTGQSTHVFQEYFSRFMPDGVVVTCDIKNYVDLSSSPYNLPNVKQVKVYPHFWDICQHHNVNSNEMLPFTQEDLETSVDKNTRILLGAIHQDLLEYTEPQEVFDFCFLDGDHHQLSLEKDLAIVQRLLRKPQYILLDDTEEWAHDSARYFHEKIKIDPGLDSYQFQDWPVAVGAALIWNSSKEQKIENFTPISIRV